MASDSNDVSSEAEAELCRMRERLRAAEEGRENAEVRAAELSRELTAALSAVDAHTKQCAALEAQVQQVREAGETAIRVYVCIQTQHVCMFVLVDTLADACMHYYVQISIHGHVHT